MPFASLIILLGIIYLPILISYEECDKSEWSSVYMQFTALNSSTYTPESVPEEYRIYREKKDANAIITLTVT